MQDEIGGESARLVMWLILGIKLGADCAKIAAGHPGADAVYAAAGRRRIHWATL